MFAHSCEHRRVSCADFDEPFFDVLSDLRDSLICENVDVLSVEPRNIIKCELLWVIRTLEERSDFFLRAQEGVRFVEPKVLKFRKLR